MSGRTRLEELRARRPLIHCVCNHVTASDCANALLALGAGPIMAEAPEEMEEITRRTAATVLNTGTPTGARYELCAGCGELAGKLGRPVVLDPVGVGGSAWRLACMRGFLHLCTPTVLRLNLGEARAMLTVGERTGPDGQGVDSTAPASREERLDTAARLARARRCVVLLTGPEDIASDGTRSFLIPGGSPLMTRVTGTGCMLSCLCGAFLTVEPDALSAAVLSAVFWNLCAERAAADAAGPGSFRAALMDAAAATDGESLEARAAAVPAV